MLDFFGIKLRSILFDCLAWQATIMRKSGCSHKNFHKNLFTEPSSNTYFSLMSE